MGIHTLRPYGCWGIGLLAGGLIGLSCCLVWAQSPPIDRTQLERVEDLAEDLANQLHDLSLAVRGRDMEGIAAHLSDQLKATGWPVGQGEKSPETGWNDRIEWTRYPEGLDKGAFVRNWEGYLEDLSHIEDVRFKVKQVRFDGEKPETRAHARVYIAIVGRDGEGRRIWVEAKAHINATGTHGGHWSIDRFHFDDFRSRVASVDLFSEIALSAGVYHADPPFGTPDNPGFIAHGAAIHDVDRDGLTDVFTTGHRENFLYLNRGDGTFEDRAAGAEIKFTPNATAPLFLDYDNDGDSDLFLAAVGHQMLFENRLVPDGRLAFVDVSYRADMDHPALGFSAVGADVNRDGYPDIYVASYNRYGLIMPDSWSRATNGTPNLLFINQGDGRFEERASEWGIADRRWSYAAHFGDLDSDGRMDLYLANDFGENALYLNEGDRFRDAAEELGMLDPGNGMGVSLGDYDNDGRLDIHVTNMSSTAGNRILQRLFPDEAARLDQTRVLNKLAAGNTVFRNLGGGKFQDVTADIGPFGAGWAWGGGFVDLDNDGWQDLHTPNGFISGKSLKDT